MLQLIEILYGGDFIMRITNISNVFQASNDSYNKPTGIQESIGSRKPRRRPTLLGCILFQAFAGILLFFLPTRRASLGEWTGDDMAFPSLSFCFVLSSIRWLAIPKACRRWLISILEAMTKSDFESNDDGSDWCQTTTSSGVTHLRRRILQL